MVPLRPPCEKRNMPRSIPRSHFRTMVIREARSLKPNVRFKRKAITLFHEALEDYLIDVFQHAQELSSTGKRKTVFVRDLQHAVEALQPAPKLVLKIDISDNDTASVSGSDDEGTEASDANTGPA